MQSPAMESGRPDLAVADDGLMTSARREREDDSVWIGLDRFVMRGAGGDTGFVAQKFVNYVCDDGTPLTAAFFQGDRSMRMQLSGKALALPQRLSASGARYAKGGVSFWIKGQEATLKQPKRKATTMPRAVSVKFA